MNTYTQVLEFFMENGVQLSPDQMNELKTVCEPEEYFVEGYWKNFQGPTEKLFEARGLSKSNTKFLGAPIWLEDKDLPLSSINSHFEDSFKEYMNNGGKQFFTKNQYGKDIRNISKHTVRYVVVDVVGSEQIIYTVICSFKEGELPFSIRMTLDMHTGELRTFPGNIRVK